MLNEAKNEENKKELGEPHVDIRVHMLKKTVAWASWKLCCLQMQ